MDVDVGTGGVGACPPRVVVDGLLDEPHECPTSLKNLIEVPGRFRCRSLGGGPQIVQMTLAPVRELPERPQRQPATGPQRPKLGRETWIDVRHNDAPNAEEDAPHRIGRYT
ncbi:hypothetical protein GCM10027186_32310 [Micromonospora schwarzwaldensis]